MFYYKTLFFFLLAIRVAIVQDLKINYAFSNAPKDEPWQMNTSPSSMLDGRHEQYLTEQWKKKAKVHLNRGHLLFNGFRLEVVVSFEISK